MIFPLLLLGGIFWLSKRKRKGSPKPLPAPSDWGDVELEFEVFPPKGDLSSLPPLPAPHIAMAADDCSVVVVGKEWWPIALEHAKKLKQAGAIAVGEKTLERFFPDCFKVQTKAFELLRREIDRRAATRNYGSSGVPGFPLFDRRVRNRSSAGHQRTRNSGLW